MEHPESFKIVIHLQRRRDGGLRAWSDDVPGLILSHSDPDRVLADIIPSVETIMSEVLGYAVVATPLRPAWEVAPTSRRPLTVGERFAAFVQRLSVPGETREYATQPVPAYASPCVA